MKFNKCVLVHDAKPDYGLVTSENSDPNVATVWDRFRKYELVPVPAHNVKRVGFYGHCDPKSVDIYHWVQASDLSPFMLAGFFFPEANEQLQLRDSRVPPILLKRNRIHWLVSWTLSKNA